MPFKSQAELNSMMASDPQKAMQYIRDARAMGKPVVSSSNPGYGEAAKRRLEKQMRKRTAENKNEGGTMMFDESYK